MATKLDDDALERLFDALSNDHAPHAAVAEPTIPLDADGKPIVVGAFYVLESGHAGRVNLDLAAGPCLCVRPDGVVLVGGWTYYNAADQLRREPMVSVHVLAEDFGMPVVEVRSAHKMWKGRVTEEQRKAIERVYDAEQREREATRRETSCREAEEKLHEGADRANALRTEPDTKTEREVTAAERAKYERTPFDRDGISIAEFREKHAVKIAQAEAVRRVLELEAAIENDHVKVKP